MAEMDRRTALAAGALATTLAAASSAAQAAPRRLSAAQQLDVLAARAAIEEVLYDYARGNDHSDEAMIRSCFWPESSHKHGGFDGTSMGFVDFAMRLLPKLKYSKHHISNVAVRVKGNRAFSECYYYAHHRRDNAAGSGEEDIFFEGRYIDFFERRGDAWKIIRRRGMSDWTSVPEPAATPYSAMPPGTHALRSKDDDYYKMLAEFEAR